MRPGSPVKPVNNWTRPPMSLPQNPPVAAVPATVWVALATFTKAVQINNTINADPLSGGPQAIFNRPKAEVVEVNAAEVVAVCATKTQADQAVADHKARHDKLQAEYVVTEHRIGVPEAPVSKPADTYDCIGGCGRTLSGGVSYCEPCRQKLWASSGWRGED